MSRKYTILALVVSMALWLANSADPPDGHTGAPGEGLCSDCHQPPSSGQTGMIALTGLPTTIQPNTNYPLTITNTHTNDIGAVKAGFQIVFLNSNNQQAGSFVPGSAAGGSHFHTTAGRTYWEHFPAQNYPSAPGSVSWTATWTSPGSPANTTITYYAAGNVANGNGFNTGDFIVTTTGSGMLNGGGSSLAVSITNSVNVLCFGGATGSATAAATGGVMPYTYNWSNGGSGATITNLTAGTYTVTATDNAASTATASVTITQPSNLVFTTPNITNVSCNGGNTGSITAGAAGGVSPYMFTWSTGGSGATISNLTAGSYTVTVKDDNNCTKMATYMVTQPALIVINLVNLTNESCAGAMDGAITISVTGGVAPIFTEWSNGFIGNSINGLEPGDYSVTVTDNNNCTKTASYTIAPGGTVNVDLINIMHVTCPGGSNGAITVLASGGTPPYTYMWSNGATGASVSNLAAGSYLVTATDNKGCQKVNFYSINQPPAFNLSISQAQSNLCFGDANVDLTATVSGGNPPYTSLWSNGVTGLSNPDLAAGTYTITITDNSGCTSTASSVVTQPALLVVMVSTTDETGIGSNDGTATALATGGTAGYTYAWSNGGTSDTITGLAPGAYTVTVTDANGCVATGVGQVDAFGCSLAVMLGPDITICQNDTAILSAVTMGESGAVTYLWSQGSTASVITISSAGEYCVTVQDEAGCQDADCILVTETVLTPFNCVVTNETAPGQNDGTITCPLLPNVVAYLWSNGDTTMSISNLAPAQYCLSVTDANGCTAAECYTVQSGNCNLIITSLIMDNPCADDTLGSISVSVENATPPVTFSWSTGSDLPTIENLSAGVYSVTIADAAGCTEIRNDTIREPEPLLITVDTIIPIGTTEGHILITASGGVSPYMYLWTNPVGATNTMEDQLLLTIEGYYSVVLMDANGCVSTLDSIFLDRDVAVHPNPNFTPLSVYPVPVRDQLYIAHELSVKAVYIAGIDGREVLQSGSLLNNTLDVSGLDSGWYILRITDGERWYIARMVK